jgi:uncharacterized protein (DUF305 family)
MKLRWLGVTGTVLLLVGLVLMAAGPRLWPVAFFGARAGAIPGGMMGGQGGMMGGQGGMIGMMVSEDGMMSSLMSGTVGGDTTQPFDLRFLDQMVPHHQMAVHSAHMIAGSARPELRDLARRITGAQQAEIDQMGQWRANWFQNAAAAPSLTMMGSGMMSGSGGMMGGGMMGSQELMDRRFLEMMIPHHEAAIGMAHQALDESQRAEIRGLAEAIIASQTAEVAEMRGYLRDFFGVATP